MAKALNIEGWAPLTALAGEHWSSNLLFVWGSQSEESKEWKELKS